MIVRMTAAEAKSAGLLKPKRRKYGNVPVVVDGTRFASKREAKRYGELLALEKAGKIERLECQVRYAFVVNGIKIGSYTADFRYLDLEQGWVVEDSKGYRPRDWARTKKLMRACFGITVIEV